MHQKLWTVPNLLSAARLAIAPALLLLAWLHQREAFLTLLVLSLATDILDGKIARWLNQASEFGARLDSWADLATFSSLPVCALWLRPEIVSSEAIWFWSAIAAYAIPIATGFARFRSLTSYHTRGAVLSAYVLGAAAVVVFANGPAWPFRLAVMVLVLAALEEIAITLVLPGPAINVRSLRHALALRQGAAVAS